MSTFTVRWEEDIEADSPSDATEKARAILAGPPGMVFFTITTGRGDELEMDVATGRLRYTRQIPEHAHDFSGDQDTCTVYRECPLTWGEFRAQHPGEHVHRFKMIGSWPAGPDGETGSLRGCSCGAQITTEEN